MRGTVVTGTDTNVGKSVVCAVLLAALRRLHPDGVRRYWKPFQTGSPPDDDTATVAALAGLEPEESAPPTVRLALPASPHEAALAAGRAIGLPLRPPVAPPETAWVVEGAGGLLVPLSPTATLADAFTDLDLPLVVVARPEVGTLNHTLLTLEAARRRGLTVLAVVVSRPPTDAVRQAIARHGAVEPVLVLPEIASISAAAVDRASARALEDPAWRQVIDRIAGDSPRATAGADLLARDAAHAWHPYTQHGLGVPPLPVVAAEGAWLHLADGRRVLDGISSWWTTLFGHGEPAIAAAIARQARALDHVMFAGATHAPAVDLADRLVRAAPAGLTRVFYSDDGSTAVEAALKMAVAWHARQGEPGRTGILALEHGYHGDTVGAMSVSAESPFTHDYRSLRFPCERVPVPGHGRSEAACLAALDDLLARKGSTCAAMIVEPLLMGAGGMRVTTPSFLRGIRERTARHGLLLIADEVLTAFGRTGALFACGTAGVSPDLLCVSKALTGGTLPLAATLATERVFEAFRSERREDAFLHGHSFTANPIACAAAVAALDLLEARGLSRADAIGQRIGKGLAELAGRPCVRDVRGIGPMRAVEIDDPDGRGYLAGAAARMAAAALEHDVLLRPLGTVVYALPPLCVTDAECDRIALALCAAVRAGTAAS